MSKRLRIDVALTKSREIIRESEIGEITSRRNKKTFTVDNHCFVC